MAATLVGGAFLGAFLNVVFDRLDSPLVVNFIRGKKLGPLLERLKTTLKVVRAVLNDAEKKQITDSDVKDWPSELKHVVYMADDLLDEVSTKAATATQKEIVTWPVGRTIELRGQNKDFLLTIIRSRELRRDFVLLDMEHSQ